MTEKLALTSGVTEINGRPHMVNNRGHYIPAENVRAADKLEDQLVRMIFNYADDLHAQIERFKGHCFDDIGAHLALVGEQYGAKPKGGVRGNMQFTSFDGCLQVLVAVADLISYGPELQVAKQLFDECLAEWGADAHPAIRQLLQDAFNTEKTGQVSRDLIFRLLRTEVDDPRWRDAQRALKDSMRPEATKTYIRFRRRARPTDRWQNVTISIAAADLPPAAPATVDGEADAQ